MKKICVFCGSSKGKNPIFAKTAERLGLLLSSNNIGLVYGGGDVGLMGILARSVMENNGHVTGVIPELLYQKVPHTHISELFVVKDMHERKSMMYKLSDGFICLPGGIGSLEELMEVFTWVQLGYLHKPVCILNINNYYSPLLMQFEVMMREGFLKETHHKNLIIKTELDNIIEEMFASQTIYEDKWE